MNPKLGGLLGMEARPYVRLSQLRVTTRDDEDVEIEVSMNSTAIINYLVAPNFLLGYLR